MTTKDSILPKPSSRFLKYLGLDAHQKPSLKEFAGISPSSTQILNSQSQSNSSLSSENGPVSVMSLLPDSVEKFGQPRHVSTVHTPTLSVRPVQYDGDLSGHGGSISIPPRDHRLYTYPASSPASPTTSHAPSWSRKLSLPLIPLWSSSFNSSRTSIETPQLSPTADSYTTGSPLFPLTPNAQRPSMRSRAHFRKPIEPMQYIAPPQPISASSHMTHIMHPQFDFETRRTARSLSLSNQIAPNHPFAMPLKETTAVRPPPTSSSRLSTFLELTQYLAEDDSSSTENGDESIVEFADVLAGGKQPKTTVASPPLIGPFKSENAVSLSGFNRHRLAFGNTKCSFHIQGLSPQISGHSIIMKPQHLLCHFRLPNPAAQPSRSSPRIIRYPHPRSKANHNPVRHRMPYHDQNPIALRQHER